MGRPALTHEVSRDPSRAALADAIVKLAERREAHDAVRAGLSRAESLVNAGFRELEAVEDEIKQAGVNQRDEIVASVMRGDDAPNLSKRADAERRKAEIEERIAAAREAREALQEAVRDHEYSVSSAERKVADCRTVVLWDALPAVIEAALPIQAQLAAFAQAISAIQQHTPANMGSDDPRRRLARDAKNILKPVLAVDLSLPTVAFATWQAAAERLLTDPDAPLPGAPLPLSNAA